MNYNTVILPQVLLCSLSEGTLKFPGKERKECLACKLFVTVPGNMTPRTNLLSQKLKSEDKYCGNQLRYPLNSDLSSG